MKRFLIVVLLLTLSSVTYAQHGHNGPLCPNKTSPDCVVPNWGQTEPDGLDGAIAPRNSDSLAAATKPIGIHMTVGMQTVAARTGSPTPTLTSVVSPEGLFVRETAALTSALKRARFYDDGTFASGQPAVERAAAELAQKAGTKYTLTLYVKVQRTLRPDEAGLLDKKVRSINDIIEKPGQRDAAGTQGK